MNSLLDEFFAACNRSKKEAKERANHRVDAIFDNVFDQLFSNAIQCTTAPPLSQPFVIETDAEKEGLYEKETEQTIGPLSQQQPTAEKYELIDLDSDTDDELYSNAHSSAMVLSADLVQEDKSIDSKEYIENDNPITTMTVTHNLTSVPFIQAAQSNKYNLPEPNQNSPQLQAVPNMSFLRHPDHVCSECGQLFTTALRLKVHRSVHVNVDKTRKQNHQKKTQTVPSQFACQQCSKIFTKQDRLKDHLRCHSNERPNQCQICQASFARKSHLTKHIKFVHQQIDHMDIDARGLRASSPVTFDTM